LRHQAGKSRVKVQAFMDISRRVPEPGSHGSTPVVAKQQRVSGVRFHSKRQRNGQHSGASVVRIQGASIMTSTGGFTPGPTGDKAGVGIAVSFRTAAAP
jgi:hypothetical protein